MIAKYFIIALISFSTAETSDDTTKSPVLPDYCCYLEAGVRDLNLNYFVHIVNHKYYKKQHKRSLPRLMEECFESFDEMLNNCEITTKLREKIMRPAVSHSTPASDAPSNVTRKKIKMEEVGRIDIRTVNYTDTRPPPMVIKLRYIKRACFSMALLLKFMNVETFDNLFYPNEKIILLALTFSASGNPAISEWMAFFYQNGEVVGAQKNTTCLEEPEFDDMEYRGVPLKEYFTKVYK